MVFHPQSNGKVERFVDTFKRALLKCELAKTIQELLEIFLRDYRATTNLNAPNGNSTAEVLINCKILLQ